MPFTERLNRKDDGHLITDEKFTLASDRIYKLAHHNLINNAQLEVWTGVGKTGTQITDFTIGQNVDKNWVYELTFGAGVALEVYYVTYQSQGDKNDADDINLIQNSIESLEVQTLNGRLVATYVHSGNPSIYPISLDRTTGIFTTDTPIGLSAGVKKTVFTVIDDYKNGVIPREWKGIYEHAIEVIDDYNFYVLEGNQSSTTRLTYPNTNNVTVDPTMFHFEYDYPNAYDIYINDLNLNNIKVVIYGMKSRPGYSYIYIEGTHDSGTFNQYIGGITDGRDYQRIYAEQQVRYNPATSHMFAEILRFVKSEWADGSGTWGMSHQANSMGAWTWTYDNLKFTKVRGNYPIHNGYTVKIYEMGEF